MNYSGGIDLTSTDSDQYTAAKVGLPTGEASGTGAVSVSLDNQQDAVAQRVGRPTKTRRAAVREARFSVPHLQYFALRLGVPAIGVAAFLTTMTSDTRTHFIVSVLLAAAIWRISFGLLRARDSREPLTAAQAAWMGDYRRVEQALLIAVGVSLLWFSFTRAGFWWYALAVAAAVTLAHWRSGWLALALQRRVLALPGCYYLVRSRPSRRAQRSWGRAQATAWPTIGLLALLNILIMVALLAAAKLPWTAHTNIAFAVLFYVDALLLKNVYPSSRSTAQQPSQSYSLTPKATDIPEVASATTAKPSQRPSSGRDEKPVGNRSRRRQRLLAARPQEKIRKRVALACVALVTGWIGFAHPGPLLVLGVLVVGAAVLSTLSINRHQAITMLLAIGTGVAAVDYISWRFAVTNWQGWWFAVPLLFAEVLGAIHTLGFQVTVWPWPAPVLESTEDPTQLAIFIMVPTANEGASTLRPTLEGCIVARQNYLAQYPDGQVTIVVCNDGRVANYPHWAEIETLALELDVRCITRSIGGGAKAGNIENARQLFQIKENSLLAIFDADQVPKPDFLLKTVPPFADSTVAWVQSGQYYANLNNPVSRWADDQASMFYSVLCPGKAALNANFICGTNVVIRGAALDEIGGLPQDSVTEDFAASIALHPRWRSIYLTDVLATGLGPLDIPSFLKQQGRWALGTMGVLRSNWRDIMLPKKNGLRLAQRFQYFLACTHYLCGLRDLIYLIGPVLFIFTGTPAVRTATLSSYLSHFLPYAILGILGLWYSSQGITGLRGVIIGFGSTPALIGSLLAVILNRKKPFSVTSKELQERQSYKYLRLYVIALVMCIAALAWATQVTGRQATSMFISVLWVVYSIVLLTSFLWLALEDIRMRRREAAELMGKQAYPSKLVVRKQSLRPVLNLGLAALLAAPVLFNSRLAGLPIFTGSATPFVITKQQVGAHHAGLSLPIQLLRSQPAPLEHELDTHFSIIGRTQDISDQFDTSWANELAAQGTRPWIDLEFGGFGADNKPSLTADLTAIINGVDDGGIARWAAEIRNFGKPVYLTVLLQADKNWSLSSGVANGGIPEDVPKAWLHIQSIFKAAGANNVAWVWSSADPLHDQQFAPPPATINVVLQDFINYPGTKWKDPVKVLRSLALRYPGKPLFVEVSAAGPAAEKSAWFRRLGQAVADCPQLYTLFYHQGGPASNPTPAQAQSWSLASDPRSLAAWKKIMSSLHAAAAS